MTSSGVRGIGELQREHLASLQGSDPRKVRDIVGLYLNPPERWSCVWTRSRRFRRSIAPSRVDRPADGPGLM